MRLLGLACTMLLAGCGAGGGGDAPDGGADAAIRRDLSGAQSDLTTVMTGTRLVAGRSSLVGITTAGWLVYIDLGDEHHPVARAVPLAGGAAQKISDEADSFTTYVVGASVLVWHHADAEGIGPLAVWRPGAALRELSKRTTRTASGSPDGTLVAYLDNLSQDALTADLVLDRADRSARVVVAKGLALEGMCIPTFDFVGARLVAVRCTSDGSPATVTSYDASGKGVDLLTDPFPFFFGDRTGTKVGLVTDGLVASVVPVEGGKPILAGIPEVSMARFVHDGSALLYVTTAGALVRQPFAGGAKVTLQASGVLSLDALSLDQKYIVFNRRRGETFTDLYLASAIAAGPPTTLWAMTTAATNGGFGITFTADSSHALFFTDVDENRGVGALAAQPVAGGQAKPVAARSNFVWRGAGARVIYSESFTLDDGLFEADLHTVDLAKGDAPSLIATRAAPNFRVTADGKSIIYFTSADPDQAGIYIAPLP